MSTSTCTFCCREYVTDTPNVIGECDTCFLNVPSPFENWTCTIDEAYPDGHFVQFCTICKEVDCDVPDHC